MGEQNYSSEAFLHFWCTHRARNYVERSRPQTQAQSCTGMSSSSALLAYLDRLRQNYMALQLGCVVTDTSNKHLARGQMEVVGLWLDLIGE